MEIERIAVVGGGLMGSGIAQVVAQAGFQVIVVEIDESALDRGFTRIDRSLDRFVGRGTITGEQAAATRARLTRSTDLEGSTELAARPRDRKPLVQPATRDEPDRADPRR